MFLGKKKESWRGLAKSKTEVNWRGCNQLGAPVYKSGFLGTLAATIFKVGWRGRSLPSPTRLQEREEVGVVG